MPTQIDPDTIAYDLTYDQLENSDLADLARSCGYSSLCAVINGWNAWSMTAGEIAKMIRREEVAE